MITPDELRNYVSEMNGMMERIIKAGNHYAKSKQVYERFHELKKPTLAREKIKIGKITPGSDAKLEMHGLASDTYWKWAEDMVDAEEEKIKAHVQWTTLTNRNDALRTIISLAKEVCKI